MHRCLPWDECVRSDPKPTYLLIVQEATWECLSSLASEEREKTQSQNDDSDHCTPFSHCDDDSYRPVAHVTPSKDAICPHVTLNFVHSRGLSNDTA